MISEELRKARLSRAKAFTEGKSPADKQIAAITTKGDDLDAALKSVSDAAALGAPLWLSYIFLLFYIAIAAGAVTHKELLLESPIELPFLSIKLPLKAFFLLAPALFLIVHAYVMAHFAMLAGKAKAFADLLRLKVPGDAPVDHAIRDVLRRQLPINVFAQFLVGPSDVRRGGFSLLLWIVAWATLVAGPVLVLLLLQLQFLPYHAPLVTLWHRGILILDLCVIWWLWKRILSGRDAGRPNGENGPFRTWNGLLRFAKNLLALPLTAAIVFFSVFVATFPGEWDAAPATLEDLTNSDRITHSGKAPDVIPRKFISLAKPWVLPATEFVFGKIEALADSGKGTETPAILGDWPMNRLRLPEFDIYAGLGVKGSEDIKWKPYTFSLKERRLEHANLSAARLDNIDLRGANLDGAVLREAKMQKANFDGASLQAASLNWAQLQGASFNCDKLCAHLRGASLRWAHLEGASLKSAQLQGVSFRGAQLQQASLEKAQLQYASLDFAALQGASLGEAWLQGASLAQARLEGASLDGARILGASLKRAKLWGATLNCIGERPRRKCADLRGADLVGAELQGASLLEANLQSASLFNANLQGAKLDYAQLQGANLDLAQLQAAELNRVPLDGASLDEAYLWRSKIFALVKNEKIYSTSLHWQPESLKSGDDKATPWTDVDYIDLKNRVGNLTLDSVRNAALKRIAFLDCKLKSRDISPCDPKGIQPQYINEIQALIESASVLNMSTLLTAQAGILRSQICSGDADAIHILRRKIKYERPDEFKSTDFISSELAHVGRQEPALIDDITKGNNCPVTKDLTDADVSRLSEIVREVAEPLKKASVTVSHLKQFLEFRSMQEIKALESETEAVAEKLGSEESSQSSRQKAQP